MSVTLHTSPALLEFQSPTQAVIAARIPLSGRMTIWVIAATILSAIAAAGFLKVDRVVAVPGKIVAKTPNIVVQPLETAIIRQIDVHEGQLVHAGDSLVRLDPTFAAADQGGLDSQVASLQAEVDRLSAESKDQPYLTDGTPPSQLQAMIFAQRHAERTARLETYRQRIDSARAKVAQTVSDIAGYAEEYRAAQTKEAMRQQLEKLQIGSRLNTLDAGAQRAEVNRSLLGAVAANAEAKSDFDGLIAERDAFLQQSDGETAQQLTEQGRRLADARQQQDKARLRRQLVDLRADRDAIVLNVARASVGSVVQSGDELITLVPADATLAIEASLPSRDAGFVQQGNTAVIKFDTFPYTTHGTATATLQTVSADSFATPQHDRPARAALAQPDADGSATYFRAALSLDELKLRNLPAGFHMTPGMTLTADIKVGRRTVLAYLLSRAVPTLSEAMREP
jgi:HlyD family secretion protein